MYTQEQIEKSGEHHDKVNAIRTKITMWFAMPCAIVLLLMLIGLILVSMSVAADVAQAFSIWARGVSQHPVQQYAWLVLSYGWKICGGLFLAFLGAMIIFDAIVIRTWPKN